ncbi:ribonucleoside-diphosphate reductase class II [Ruminiclostridium sufflavum DSM 19573]|uniref:Vitamin B12-dependent ribonucleotide reductase n=1 Tax=Ruminiclostridium sufflavum DSM 19573 TaxID=1121337 RepID=A0A318Y256_9FIRM|nr:vitamin B12-dependent ribonucleotide reductase [Ruminiclostridium sufflavum]PYG85636.1 ribonucleoside-diphosphate reductase class II [Ruminiclostridium sufflavum DSM 19573]
MKLSENAVKVLEKRYLSKDENGNLLENCEGMFRRVAKAVASADAEYTDEKGIAKLEQEFFDMMADLEFLPNSPTLMNAGRPLGQLSACFVLPVEDTMEDIFEAIKNAALIHKSGGGTGFSFSRLRPKGATVNSTGGVASGPISFMKVFNAATEAVKQGGTRRGANMGILRIDHPDILDFISCKKDNSEITNFNLSVGITEDFMKAAEHNLEYELIDPKTKLPAGKLNAKNVLDSIVEMAWKNGEPGIIFLDRLNKDNVVPKLGEIESTNPCGEQPLLPYEACNLGSINLYNMLTDDGKALNFAKLAETVKKAVHFLDNVIEVNKYPLPEIDKMTRGTRKIGLGIMGWADILCSLGIPYNSQKAIDFADKVMGFIQENAQKASRELAEIKGVFPYYEDSVFADRGLRLRNATVTTIAPTGTLSLIAGVSSGIEPIFAISYIRNVMDNNELIEVNQVFRETAVRENFYSDELMRRIARVGTVRDMEGVPGKIQNIFVTAHDVSPEWHVKMQAAFQRHTDNAVSKTVNLGHTAATDDVREVFILAYKTGCKGVTIYRDGSRDLQVLNIGGVKGKEEAAGKSLPEGENVYCDSCKENNYETILVKNPGIEPRPRPEITTGFTEKVKIGCGNLYITVNYDDNGICEVFTNTGRAGGCPSQSEATSRLISVALRSGMDVKAIVEQLKGIRCPSTIRQKGLKVLSCPDAIGRLIEKVAKIQNGRDEEVPTEEMTSEYSLLQKPTARTVTDEENEIDFSSVYDTCPMKTDCANQVKNSDKSDTGGVCPECGEPVEHEGGCMICRHCGFSKCG